MRKAKLSASSMNFVSELLRVFSWVPQLTPILSRGLLIDMLLNLGKTEGSVDAGQMIKPALARGLQLVGATTRVSIIANFITRV
jgi:hypothetical protein